MLKKPLVITLLLVAIVLISWQQLASAYGQPRLFPSISYLFNTSLPSISNFGPSTATGTSAALAVIGYHLLLSVIRTALGLLLGVIAGLLYGVFIHYFDLLRFGNKLLLIFFRSIPLLALIPLFLVWFGGTEVGIVLYVAFAIFVIIATNTYEAILNVPVIYKSHALLLGASKFQMFKDVIFPGIFAEIYGSLKYIIGTIWAISLASEYLAGSEGLGFLIYQSYTFADMGKLIIFSVIYCLLSIFSYIFLKSFALQYLKWK